LTIKLVFPICESPTIPTFITTLFFSPFPSNNDCEPGLLGPGADDDDEDGTADMTDRQHEARACSLSVLFLLKTKTQCREQEEKGGMRKKKKD
jgi:hypothetical protein